MSQLTTKTASDGRFCDSDDAVWIYGVIFAQGTARNAQSKKQVFEKAASLFEEQSKSGDQTDIEDRTETGDHTDTGDQTESEDQKDIEGHTEIEDHTESGDQTDIEVRTETGDHTDTGEQPPEPEAGRTYVQILRDDVEAAFEAKCKQPGA